MGLDKSECRTVRERKGNPAVPAAGQTDIVWYDLRSREAQGDWFDCVCYTRSGPVAVDKERGGGLSWRKRTQSHRGMLC